MFSQTTFVIPDFIYMMIRCFF